MLNTDRDKKCAARISGHAIIVRVTSAILLVSLAACGGSDSGGGSSSTPPIVTVTPTPSTPTPTPGPTPSPTPTSWSAAAAALYDRLPDAASCQPGTLKASVRQTLLAQLNALRALHGLPAVVHSDVANQAAAEASLMMAANRALSHTPPSSWTCHTAAGAAVAASSNLIGGWGNGLPWSSDDGLLAGWMTERNSASIGHRRWILDPFLGQITYGRVAYQTASGDRLDGATMKVFDFTTPAPVPAAASVPGFVAYPYRDYPARYFGTNDILSFTVVANKSGRYSSGNSAVGYDNATISVSAGGTSLAVKEIESDDIGYGVPNSIQWRVTGLQAGITYDVRIAGITNAPQTSYEYQFRIMN